MRSTHGTLFGSAALLNLLRVGDAAAATCAMGGALVIWSAVEAGSFTLAYMRPHAAWFLLIASWLLLLPPAWRPAAIWRLTDTAVVVAHAAVGVGLLYVLVFLLAPRDLLPRLVVVYFLTLAFSMTMAWRFVFVRVSARAAPRNRVVIVGVGAAARITYNILRAMTPYNQALEFHLGFM